MDRIGRFSILRMWLHYFLKVTPILMFAVLFFMSINKYLGDGPLNTFLISTQVEPCNNYWWSVLLYVQNYVNPTELVSWVIRERPSTSQTIFFLPVSACFTRIISQSRCNSFGCRRFFSSRCSSGARSSRGS